MFKLETEESTPVKGGNANGEPKTVETVSNRIYFYSEVDRENILKLNKGIRELVIEHLHQAQIKESEPSVIKLHINSYGGSIFAGVAGMDEIINATKQVDVHTVVDGVCASAGTFLSVVGTKRYINKHAYMLIHQLSAGMWGKYAEFTDEMQNLTKLMDMIKKLYKEHTKIPTNKIEEILKHDLFFDANECKKYGLVDYIL